MTFLERILETKREEVLALQRSHDLQTYTRTGCHPETGQRLTPTRGFQAAVREGSTLALIAEVKQASPSKGQIATAFDPVQTAATYERAGASAVSVLTDVQYFKGSIGDLEAVRKTVSLPVLRKDFIIDELQIAQARLAGADAVLLICAALSSSRLVELSNYAKSIGIDTLVEVHHERELEAALAAEPSVLGINNRDLHTFEVSLETTQRVLQQVPERVTAIAESGVRTQEDAALMAQYGAQGILVGEALMRTTHDSELARLIQTLRVSRAGQSDLASSNSFDESDTDAVFQSETEQ